MPRRGGDKGEGEFSTFYETINLETEQVSPNYISRIMHNQLRSSEGDSNCLSNIIGLSRYSRYA